MGTLAIMLSALSLVGASGVAYATDGGRHHGGGWGRPGEAIGYHGGGRGRAGYQSGHWQGARSGYYGGPRRHWGGYWHGYVGYPYHRRYLPNFPGYYPYYGAYPYPGFGYGFGYGYGYIYPGFGHHTHLTTAIRPGLMATVTMATMVILAIQRPAPSAAG